MMKKRAKGFTLMEVMVATAVLSLGSLFIYQSFFSVLRAFDYCSGYIAGANFLQEKLWEGTESIRHGGALGAETEGEFTVGARNFTWSTDLAKVNDRLYEVDVAVRWRSGKQQNEVSRSTYALYENSSD